MGTLPLRGPPKPLDEVPGAFHVTARRGTLAPMTIEDYRHFYAEEIRYCADVSAEALVEAYARVPRERFLSPGPWQISAPGSRALSIACASRAHYRTIDDPRHLYHDVVVVLDLARDINNGQPTALARWIDALELQPGNRAYHLGCGVGYYTAIIAEVVGPTGAVTGVEYQEDLAARAGENLTGYPNVTAQHADGAAFDPGPSDAIFVNAGSRMCIRCGSTGCAKADASCCRSRFRRRPKSAKV